MSEFEYEFENNDATKSNFDLKGLLFKIISFWPLILVSVIIGLSIAHYFNVRKENIYRLESLIAVENDQTPFSTASTSISFNWGGVSSKVGKVITEINTRTHNELVVDSLEFYKQYLKQGEYFLKDIYKNSPFITVVNKGEFQVLSKLIQIKPITDETFELSIDFGESQQVKCQNYTSKAFKLIAVSSDVFKQKYRYGEAIELPFLSVTIVKNSDLSFE
ncbi:MAG: sugar transporter, partial [Winogradskyella sp.]